MNKESSNISNNPVRVAVIGCGELAREKLLGVLALVPEISVVALCDVDGLLVRETAKRFGIAKHCADAAEIFAMAEVEAVGVCTEPGFHTELAIDAMRAGKHVLVEKPLALTTAECERLIAEAQAASVVAMTGFHMRFHRLVRQAKELIRQGVLGQIDSVRVVWHSPRSDEGLRDWRFDREQGGGALVEIAVHHFDVVRFLFESEFEEIYAMSLNGVRDDESSVFVARLANQTLVAAEFSERTPHEIEIVISGRKGLLRLDGQRFDGLEVRMPRETNGAPAVRLRWIKNFLRTLPIGLTTQRRGGDYRMSYENEWRHFAECIRTGRTPEATFYDGLRSLEVVRAALESAATSRSVNLSRIEQVARG